MKNYILLFLLVLLSCREKSVNSAPLLEFSGKQSQSIQEGRDSLLFHLSYKDEDGDLGENESEINNLWVKDRRDGKIHSFRIPQLSPYKTSRGIEGSFSFSIKKIQILNGQEKDTARFEIRVMDRAGNESNTLLSEPVIILKNSAPDSSFSKP